MVLAGYINRIYVEFIRIYLQARRCQNADVFPGGLAVAGDPRSVADRDKRRGVRSRTVRAMNVSCTKNFSISRLP